MLAYKNESAESVVYTNQDERLEKGLARLKKYQPQSTLAMLSNEDREFVLSSDAPEVSGSKTKFKLFP